MMDGYSVPETASVLGVPEGKVWELLARGVLSGAPEGDGMRVFLKENRAPMASHGDRFAAPPPDAGSASAAEATPFRELLTEFRNLTERYGQALLALGEARGEVAGLRSRVDLLEARLDLRLPRPGIVPPVTWERPARPDQMAERESEPESPQDVRKASAPVEAPTRRATPQRRSHTARSAVAGFADALARAQDPTTAEMPSVTDVARHVAPAEAPGVEEADAITPAVVSAVAAEDEAGAPEGVMEQIADESSAPAVIEEPADTPVTPASASYTTDVIEPDWFADGDFAWLDAAEIEAQVAATSGSPAPQVFEPEPEPEPEPAPELVPQAFEPEPQAFEPAPQVFEPEPEPEPEPQPFEPEPEPPALEPEPEPVPQVFEPEPPALEPEPFPLEALSEASYFESDIGPVPDPQPASDFAEPPIDPVSTAVALEPVPEPDFVPAPEQGLPDELDRASDLTFQAEEPFHIGIGNVPPDPAPEWRRAPEVRAETVRSMDDRPLARPETRSERAQTMVDEMEVASSAWRVPVVAAAQADPVEDESLARLARQEGWDATEVEAIRALVGPGAPAEIVLPGADDLAEAIAALNAGRPATPGTTETVEAVAAVDAAASAVEPSIESWVNASHRAPEPSLRQAVFTPQPVPRPLPARQGSGDPSWLRGRRGPAATAFRRLRRLFTE